MATPIPDKTPMPANPALLLALGLGLLLAVRIGALYFSKTDLFFDEAQYWVWSNEPALGYFSKPPLLAWTIRAVTQLCGDTGEFCTRLASPLVHTGTAILVYLTARTLYDSRTGLWAGLVYATVPGVAYSAGIISTDVPLLFFFAGALFAWVKLIRTRAFRWAIVLGLSLGLGLMSKYAMVYFLLGAGLSFWLVPETRWLLRDRRIALAGGIAVALLAPNIWWNLQNGLVTITHTAANAKWQGPLFFPGKALEFFAAQFGVFGPILFAVLLAVVVRFFRRPLSAPDRTLLAFALPVIAIITVQAFLSRANANWAAVAYVPAAILVTATMLRDGANSAFRISLGLHLGVVLLLAFGTVTAGRLPLPGGVEPYARILGWKELGRQVRRIYIEQNAAAVITESRKLSAELIYYLRGSGIPVYAWRADGPPRDHFQLTRPLNSATPQPALLITERQNTGHVTALYETVKAAGEITINTGGNTSRTVRFFTLDRYKGK